MSRRSGGGGAKALVTARSSASLFPTAPPLGDTSQFMSQLRVFFTTCLTVISKKDVNKQIILFATQNKVVKTQFDALDSSTSGSGTNSDEEASQESTSTTRMKQVVR